MRYCIVAAAALALAACGSEKSGSFETDDGGEGSYTVDTEDGETTASITTEDGTVRMRSGDNVPVKLPKGFSVYPKAKVVSNTVIDQGEGTGSLIIFESEDSLEDITSYYRSQAETAGIDIALQLTTEQGRMLAGESPDGTSFSLNASEQEGKTTMTLMVGDKLN